MMKKIKKAVAIALTLLFIEATFNTSSFVSAQTKAKENMNPQIILARIRTSNTVEVKNITTTALTLDKEGFSYEPLNSNIPLIIKKDVNITAKNVTYSNAEVEGSLYVSADNARLNNVKIKGTLFINPGKDRTATINDVTAKNIYVLSGGEDGLYLNKVVSENLTINSSSKLKLETNYTTKIKTTTVTTDAILEAPMGTGGSIVVSGKDKQKVSVTLQGNFKESVIVKTNAAITSETSSSIEKINIAPEGGSAVVSLEGEFKDIDINETSKLEISENTWIIGQVNGKPYAQIKDKPLKTEAMIQVDTNNNSVEEALNGFEEQTNLNVAADKRLKEKELLKKLEKEKLRAQERIINGNGKIEKQTAVSASVEIITINDYNNNLTVVNKERSLLPNWRPADLVQVTVPYRGRPEARFMRKEAAEALSKLFAKAKKDRINLCAVSGFRSYELQKTIYARNIAELGETEAKRQSAYPGNSEHQTGLAMDISSAAMGYSLRQSFGDTREGKWLKENAGAFGFIIRYPKGKEAITGYIYEPWHVRYVGREVAVEIMRKGITLEEYFGLKK
jgi:D-alanyl-D-alanine carboxypeptidase